MDIEQFAMKQTRRRISRRLPLRRGFTFLEFMVAMVVLGVALSGLFPLLAITSRQLQPVKNPTFDCRTPARDWGTDGYDDPQTNPPLRNQRHVWRLTPYDDPWLRKLGTSAQVTSGSVASSTPVPIQSSIVFLDDYEPNGTQVNNTTDGSGTYTSTGWTAGTASGYHQDYHYHEAPTDTPSSDAAIWQLTIVADGWYSIQATWPTDTGKTLTNATYQVVAAGYNGSSAPQNNPGNGIADATANGTTWWPITAPAILHLAPGTVTVRLNVPLATVPNTFVIADAVRIVQNAVAIKSIERSLSGANQNSSNADVTAKVSVTVNIPQ
jgi:prepilin-type N-terminal cleavage/methylation domain-containing protein